MEENDPSGKNDEVKKSESIELYPNEGSSRNLLFSWPSGNCEFLNYTYLIGGKLVKEEDKIELTYTSHKVTLKGNNLKELYDALLLTLPKRIDCIEERYLEARDDSGSSVTEIEITPK